MGRPTCPVGSPAQMRLSRASCSSKRLPRPRASRRRPRRSRRPFRRRRARGTGVRRRGRRWWPPAWPGSRWCGSARRSRPTSGGPAASPPRRRPGGPGFRSRRTRSRRSPRSSGTGLHRPGPSSRSASVRLLREPRPADLFRCPWLPQGWAGNGGILSPGNPRDRSRLEGKHGRRSPAHTPAKGNCKPGKKTAVNSDRSA